VCVCVCLCVRVCVWCALRRGLFSVASAGQTAMRVCVCVLVPSGFLRRLRLGLACWLCWRPGFLRVPCLPPRASACSLALLLACLPLLFSPPLPAFPAALGLPWGVVLFGFRGVRGAWLSGFGHLGWLRLAWFGLVVVVVVVVLGYMSYCSCTLMHDR
jgi:hypothetical protein